MRPDEQTSPEQVAALRAMTGVERWRLSERLYWSARKMKLEGLRYQHPDWPDKRLADEVRRIFTCSSPQIDCPSTTASNGRL